MHESLVQWVGYVVPPIEAVGIAVVLWGIVEGFTKLLHHSVQVIRGRPARYGLDDIRQSIGEKLVLGLEFFIAGDVIQTVAVPSWQLLGMLGAIVAIRTVIVYFLDKDKVMKQ
ncbi:MAG: DUF1622 domain-containing protein [Pseudomonadota bacterium]